MYLFKHCFHYFSDIPVSLTSDSCYLCRAVKPDRAVKQQLLMILVQIKKRFAKVILRHELVNFIRAVKDNVKKISLADLPCKDAVQTVWKISADVRSAVFKRQFVTASAYFVIPFSAFPVGVEPVPPSGNVLEILNRSRRIFKTCECFGLKLSFQFSFLRRVVIFGRWILVLFKLYLKIVLLF